jgi:16S rRNA (adenine1518-N6/adenine1519-N6)-dimethyltransferase
MADSLSYAPRPPSLRQEVSALLRRYNLRPRKALGQHFLVDGRALRIILTAAAPVATDTIVEVGPGLGILTCRLATMARRVVAVELDRTLADLLRERATLFPNLEVVTGDILDLPPEQLIGERPYKVVANFPYAIAAAALRHLLETARPPQVMVVMVQKEVAENICATPGNLGLLGLGVQVFGQPRILRVLPPSAFYPPPRVQSAIVRMDVYPEPVVPASLVPHLFTMARAGFSAPRKQLRNSLAQGLRVHPTEAEKLLHRAEIDPSRRPQTLSPDEWGRLASLSPPILP